MVKILDAYNSLFPAIIVFSIVILIAYAMKIFNDNDTRRKDYYKIAIRIEVQRLVEHIIVFGILFLILLLCFDININLIVLKYNLDKVVLGIIIIYYVSNARKTYRSLLEKQVLDEATSNELERYKVGLEGILNNILVKIDLLKAFAPISLISAFVSYFLGNNELVEVNWNMYLIVFMTIIGIYIVWVIDTYSKLVKVREMCVEVEKRMVKLKE